MALSFAVAVVTKNATPAQKYSAVKAWESAKKHFGNASRGYDENK